MSADGHDFYAVSPKKERLTVPGKHPAKAPKTNILRFSHYESLGIVARSRAI